MSGDWPLSYALITCSEELWPRQLCVLIDSLLIGVGTGGPGGHDPHRFYSFSIGIRFLPYKSTLLRLYAPQDLNAFLHSGKESFNLLHGGWFVSNIKGLRVLPSQFCMVNKVVISESF